MKNVIESLARKWLSAHFYPLSFSTQLLDENMKTSAVKIQLLWIKHRQEDFRNLKVNLKYFQLEIRKIVDSWIILC